MDGMIQDASSTALDLSSSKKRKFEEVPAYDGPGDGKEDTMDLRPKKPMSERSTRQDLHSETSVEGHAPSSDPRAQDSTINSTYREPVSTIAPAMDPSISMPDPPTTQHTVIPSDPSARTHKPSATDTDDLLPDHDSNTRGQSDKETACGITELVCPNLPGFTGILKKRFVSISSVGVNILT